MASNYQASSTAPWNWTTTSSATTSNVTSVNWTATSTNTSTTVWQNWIYENEPRRYRKSYRHDPWEWKVITSTTAADISFRPSRVVWEEIVERTAEEEAAHQEHMARVRADNDRRAAEAAERRALHQAQMAEASKKAEVILLEHLDEAEQERWKTHRQVHVRSQHGRRYCIKGAQRSHNIFEMDEEGKETKELCVYLADSACPMEDNVLGQMLALQYAEDHLLQRANVWDLASGGRLYQRSAAHDPAAPQPEAVLAHGGRLVGAGNA